MYEIKYEFADLKVGMLVCSFTHSFILKYLQRERFLLSHPSPPILNL